MVTHADLHYEGSVTSDNDLMSAAGNLPNEEVHVCDVTQGTGLVTYARQGPAGLGMSCINIAAAHLNSAGELVILATSANSKKDEAKIWTPRVVLVDEVNRRNSMVREVPGPQMPGSVA